MANEFIARKGIISLDSIQVSGSITATGGITVSGSISSASFATSAATASSADNFFVRQNLTASSALFTGSITAQTLVVQTVTSSIVYSSGSNIFGNQLTDTQRFTGSFGVTGSNAIFNVCCVGINTSTPAHPLQVNGAIALGNLAEEFTSNLSYAYPIIYAGNKSGLGNGDLVIQPRTTATRGIYFATRTGGAVSATNPGIRMAITYDGLVGVGTASPEVALHVTGSSFNTGYFFSSNQFSQVWVGTCLTANKSIGIGYDSTNEYGYINVYGTTAGSSLTFKGSSVGIGYTPCTSYGPLQVKSPASSYTVDLVGRTAGLNGESQITFWNSGQTVVQGAIGNIARCMVFYAGGTEVMRMTCAGNVGIGACSPEGLLTIKGISCQPLNSGTTANSLLQIVGSLNNELNIGLNCVSGCYGAYLQVNDNNLAVNYPLNLQPNGGQVSIGTYSTSAEANLFLGAQSAGEGGQLVLQKGTSCSCATHLDNYQDTFRVLVGSDTTSTGVHMLIDHKTRAACFYGALYVPETYIQGPTISYAAQLNPAGPAYTQDLQLVICHSNWGGNDDTGTVYVEYTARAYAVSQTTAAYGTMTYRLNNGGTQIGSFGTGGVTTSCVTITGDVGTSRVLKINFAVSQNVDRITVFARTTNPFVTSVTGILV